MPINSRAGLTLIELLIALSLSGFAMLGAVMLLDQLNDSSSRISITSRDDLTAGNGDRLLRRLIADARSTTDSTQRFRGDEHSANYLTLCDRPGGWSDQCRITLFTDSLPDSTGVAVDLGDGIPVTLRRMAGVWHFRYYDAASPDSTWVKTWAISIALPTAIALVQISDTVVFPLGPSR